MPARQVATISPAGEFMLVRNWMTPDVLTVSPDTSLLKIGKMMRDNNVRRLPVVDAKGQVVGIISDRDVRDASPSKPPSLDMYEMQSREYEKAASRLDFPLPTSRGQCGLCLIFSGKKAPGYFLCFPRTTMPAKEISFSGYAAWKAVKRRINLWKR